MLPDPDSVPVLHYHERSTTPWLITLSIALTKG